MSRVHPWKSAISFAHKESQSATGSPALPPSPGVLHPFNVGGFNLTRPLSEMSQQQLAQYLGVLSAAVGAGAGPGGGVGGTGNHAVFAAADDHSRPPRSQSAPLQQPLGGGYAELTQPRPTHAHSFQQQHDADGDAADVFGPGAGASIVRPVSTGSAGGGGDVAAASGLDFMDERFLLLMQRQLAVSSNAGVHGEHAGAGGEYRATPPPTATHGPEHGTEAVLRRLCDDTYVPTQPWPVNWDIDAFFCSAVVAQLQQFGGTTTISKLRGFLRSRVNATDNIKSVPLKALLSGYPAFFVVRGNQVGLTPALLGQPPAHQQHQQHQHHQQHQQQQYHFNNHVAQQVQAHAARMPCAAGDFDVHQYGGGGGAPQQHQLMQQAAIYDDIVDSAYHQGGGRATHGGDVPDNNAVFGTLNANFAMDQRIATTAGIDALTMNSIGNSSGMGNNASSADQQSSFSYGL